MISRQLVYTIILQNLIFNNGNLPPTIYSVTVLHIKKNVNVN
jgi:hypothetical protein